MVLGKPMNLNLQDCSIIAPIDCDVPRARKTSAPSPREYFQDPSPFTLRLLEFYLARIMRDPQTLEMAGLYPRDYTKSMQIHQQTLDFMESLPPLYQFENPDTRFDYRFPWLPPQRQYLRSSTMFVLMLLHRPYLSHIRQSRRESLLCSIALLGAQEKLFEVLKPSQYAMFTFTYLAIEHCVSVLAVLLSHPGEQQDVLIDTLHAARVAAATSEKIRSTNAFVWTGWNAIQAFLKTAEAVTGPSSSSTNQLTSFDLSVASQSPIQQSIPFGSESCGGGLLNGQRFFQSTKYFSDTDNSVLDDSFFTVSNQHLQPLTDLICYNSAYVPTDLPNNPLSGNGSTSGGCQAQIIGNFDNSFWNL